MDTQRLIDFCEEKSWSSHYKAVRAKTKIGTRWHFFWERFWLGWSWRF